MKRRILFTLLCCIIMISFCSQIVLAEGQSTATCEHDYSKEVVNISTLKREGNCIFRAEYYYSCSKCGEVERNDNHIFYGNRDENNHRGPQDWIITDTKHIATCRSCKYGYNNVSTSNGEHDMNDGICSICGYKSYCVHTNENHDEKCDNCGVLYIYSPYFDEYRSGDVIPIRYYLRGEILEGDWFECSLVNRKGTIIKKERGVTTDPLNGGANMLIPEGLEYDAYIIRVSLMRDDETEGEKEIWRSEVWAAINTDGIVALDKTAEYNTGMVYDVYELFFNNRIPQMGGLEQYSLVGGTGEGTLDGTNLTITKPGTFLVEAMILPIPELSYAGKTVTATLTVTCEHIGGKATCTSKAICEYCGEEYGKFDSSNHDLEKIPAKDATVIATGNKEYWQCKDCGKYFADEKGTNEIELVDTVISKLPPEMIEGKTQSITAGENKELAFRSNAAFSEFIRVELDGKILDKKNYSVREGSIIVTLKADFVATLSAGEHTIGIVSESGTATTTFTMNAKAVADNDIKAPQTGYNSHMALWIALIFVSGAGIIGITAYGKKNRGK